MEFLKKIEVAYDENIYSNGLISFRGLLSVTPSGFGLFLMVAFL